MRRKDREVTDINEIVDIIKKCDVIRLGFSTNSAPYILPMNFGFSIEGESIVFYFHGAKEGKKLDLIRENACVGFEADCSHKLITGENACDYSMEYESIIGNGKAEIIADYNQKVHALSVIMKNYSQENEFSFPEKSVNSVVIFKLSVSEITAKRHISEKSKKS